MYKWKKMVVAVLLMCQIVALGGCTMLSEERVKLNDLGFTVLSEEVIPEETEVPTEEVIPEETETPTEEVIPEETKAPTEPEDSENMESPTV